MVVGYRVGLACSAYPTVVGGPGVYRAYERWARRARTICRGSGDRWRHGRVVPVEADPLARACALVAGRSAGPGGGGLRGRSDRVRVVPVVECRGDPMCGRRALEAAATVG